jgi:chromosomal replication initiation ATPase DnaA
VKQLSLPFMQQITYAAADFCPAPSNALAREWLARPEGWTNGRLVLWGGADCGKTHLLHIWAATRGATIHDGAHLPSLSTAPNSPVAVDDSDLTGEPRALLHLLNAAAEAGQPVLMTSRLPPARQAPKLADLASRLRASLAVEIRLPEDELLELLLTRLAAERQLLLGLGVRNFLLTRLQRTPTALREAIARLDHASLDRGVKISRNFAAALLEDMANPDPLPQPMLSKLHAPAGNGLL